MSLDLASCACSSDEFPAVRLSQLGGWEKTRSTPPPPPPTERRRCNLEATRSASKPQKSFGMRFVLGFRDSFVSVHDRDYPDLNYE